MTTINYQHIKIIERNFLNNGWAKVNLPNRKIILKIRESLNNKLIKLTGVKDINIENYHKFVSENDNDAIKWKLLNHFWNSNFSVKICEQNVLFLRYFFGPNIFVQTKPYLRIARPNNIKDNIGFHRDTAYGQNINDITIHIPLTNLTEKGCLGFMSGSHIKSDRSFKIVAKENETWAKGSKKHKMGFPYSPKEIKKFDKNKITKTPLKIGQAIIFPPSTIHGQEVNLMKNTRFSVDLRVNNYGNHTDDNKPSNQITNISKSIIKQVESKFLKNNV